MAEPTNPRGMSREEVALKLTEMIAHAEGKSFNGNLNNAVSRNWILSTYAQCKAVVENGWNLDSVLNEHPLKD